MNIFLIFLPCSRVCQDHLGVVLIFFSHLIKQLCIFEYDMVTYLYSHGRSTITFSLYGNFPCYHFHLVQKRQIYIVVEYVSPNLTCISIYRWQSQRQVVVLLLVEPTHHFPQFCPLMQVSSVCHLLYNCYTSYWLCSTKIPS